jgi:hypothetical protein
MHRCVRYADANLIWSERLGWAVFDLEHLLGLSEFVVDNSSHVESPAAERRTSDQAGARRRGRNALAPRPAKAGVCSRRLTYLRRREASHVVFASISAKRRKAAATARHNRLATRRHRRPARNTVAQAISPGWFDARTPAVPK